MESAGDNTDTIALLFPVSIELNCRSTVSEASSTWESSETSATNAKARPSFVQLYVH